MTDATSPPGGALPAGLGDAAAEQILAAAVSERAAVVRALQQAHPAHADALRGLAQELADAERVLDLGFPDSEPTAPDSIGPYRVIRRLGEGAFGTVFLCAQAQPVQRQVAVKVMRPGSGDRQTLARFDAERQVLAQLNHPAIAQVFDAGTVPDGRPFFVMEYVAGQPIGGYCAQRQLAVDARLRLFLDLCRGVEHAHRHRIVHRDLKPANVLVVESEGRPLPKIIDFGIAKALHPPQQRPALQTDTGRVVGTPGYMSPEQAAGQVADVDERADVFALGVMLYELLTGELPWSRDAGITDSEPPRPSSRVVTGTQTTTNSAPPSQRKKLAARLRGDLDWITLKALARERERRYQSVLELTADLEAHLRGAPVSAGPPSAAYRLRKFVRRHRAAVWATSAAVVAVGIGLGGAYAYGKQADTQVADARAEAATSQADAMHAVELLLARASDDRLIDAPRSDAPRQALLQDALAFYDKFLRARPADPTLRERRCRTLLKLSKVHWHLGQIGNAESTADEARSEAEALCAAAPTNVAWRALLADAHVRKGRALSQSGRQDAARLELAQAVDQLESCNAAAPETHGSDYAAALQDLAATLRSTGRGDDSIDVYRRATTVLEELQRRQPESPKVRNDLASAYFGLGQQLMFRGRRGEAERVLRLAEQQLRDPASASAEAISKVQGLFGRIALEPGSFATASRRFQSAIAAAQQWRQQQPQRLQPMFDLSIYLEFLAQAHANLSEWDEALAANRQSIALADAMVQQFPQDPTRIAYLSAALRRFAHTLWDGSRQQDLAEAETLARRALAVWDTIPASVDAHSRDPRWRPLAMLAQILEARGVSDPPTWEAVGAALVTETGNPTNRNGSDLLYTAFFGLARYRLRAGLLDEAAAALLRAREVAGKDSPKILVDLGRFDAKVAAARHDHAGAAAAADGILDVGNTWHEWSGAAHCLHAAWRCAAAAADVEATVVAGYRDRAAGLYRQVIDGLASDVELDPTDAWKVLPFGFANVRLAQIDAARGEYGSARERLAAALPLLLAVHAAVAADQWDEALVAEGRALLQSPEVRDAH
ncbi:MAG TPA: protein kinase [Planctomycetota bacterium]|nr:protein kinase [Planctomycetota bacterium]